MKFFSICTAVAIGLFFSLTINARAIIENCLVSWNEDTFFFAPINNLPCSFSMKSIEGKNLGHFTVNELLKRKINDTLYTIGKNTYSKIDFEKRATDQQCFNYTITQDLDIISLMYYNNKLGKDDKIAIVAKELSHVDESEIKDTFINVLISSFDANHFIFSCLMQTFPNKSAYIYEYLKSQLVFKEFGSFGHEQLLNFNKNTK